MYDPARLCVFCEQLFAEDRGVVDGASRPEAPASEYAPAPPSGAQRTPYMSPNRCRREHRQSVESCYQTRAAMERGVHAHAARIDG